MTAVLGNIYDGYEIWGRCERLQVSRLDLDRSRMRARTKGDVDVGIRLPAGGVLQNGDVLSDGIITIVIEQLAEKVMSVRSIGDDKEYLFLIGHAIGNMHRPISVRDDMITFPIHADSEIDMFKGMLARITDGVETTVNESVFVPHLGADVHGHT